MNREIGDRRKEKRKTGASLKGNRGIKGSTAFSWEWGLPYRESSFGRCNQHGNGGVGGGGGQFIEGEQLEKVRWGGIGASREDF